MKKIALIALAALSWTACKQSTGSENLASRNVVAIAAVDSLNKAFDDAWNKKDSAAVVALFADDVMMIAGRDLMKGKDAVAKGFVSSQIPYGGGLQTNKESKGASGDLGYHAGTWSLKVAMPNQQPRESTGNYSFVCKKVEDGSWKFSVLSVDNHDAAEEPGK